MSVKHPNESRFEFALRLTKALKDQENLIFNDDITGDIYLDSKPVLDILYHEIMNPVDPQEPIGGSTFNMDQEFNEFSVSLLNDPHTEPYRDPALLVSEEAREKLTTEVVKDSKLADTWRVEAIDYENEGKVYITLFSGPNAEQRAHDSTDIGMVKALRALLDDPETKKYLAQTDQKVNQATLNQFVNDSYAEINRKGWTGVALDNVFKPCGDSK